MADESAARITLIRRIDWIDTDAAGVYHWTTVFRLVEAAEAALHERLGIRSLMFGRTPRVHVETSFQRELRFYDAVEVRFRVSAVGRTSLTYAFTLHREAEEEEAAEGRLVVVHVTDQPGGTPAPWPQDVRVRLLEGGDQGRVGGD